MGNGTTAVGHILRRWGIIVPPVVRALSHQAQAISASSYNTAAFGAQAAASGFEAFAAGIAITSPSICRDRDRVIRYYIYTKLYRRIFPPPIACLISAMVSLPLRVPMR
jgi:ABC-type amino acid transport system permease subunit